MSLEDLDMDPADHPPRGSLKVCIRPASQRSRSGWWWQIHEWESFFVPEPGLPDECAWVVAMGVPDHEGFASTYDEAKRTAEASLYRRLGIQVTVSVPRRRWWHRR